MISKLNSKVIYEVSPKVHEFDKSLSIKNHLFYKSIDDQQCLPLVYGNRRVTENITYFYIYLLAKKKDLKCVGVTEYLTNKMINYQTRKGSLNTKFIKVNFFSHLNLKTLYRNRFKKLEMKCDNAKLTPSSSSSSSSSPGQVIQLDSIFREDIFTKTKGILLPKPLHTETAEIAKKIHSEFSKKGASWVELFFSNNNFSILENEGGADGFFACIRDAFSSIGEHTTVTKLRQKVANEVSQTIFDDYFQKYSQYNLENNTLRKTIKDVEDNYKAVQEQFLKTVDHESKKKLFDHSQNLKLQRETLILKKNVIHALCSEYSFMKSTDSLEKMQKKMQTCYFWATPWIICTLERLLNIKFIILNSYAYINKEYHDVLYCSPYVDPIISNRKSFDPDYYIIIEKHLEQYKVIGYRERQLFTFDEIPFDLKKFIKSCSLESLRFTFNFIHEFRTLTITKLKKKKDDINEEFYDSTMKNLYIDDVVFVISNHSNVKHLPGRGPRESIDEKDIVEYSNLHSFDSWRKKLHDNWLDIMNPIAIDLKHWNSLTHYIVSIKFDDTYASFFTAESSTPLSKSIPLAMAAASKTGMFKNTLIRPPEIKPDAKKKLTKQKYRECLFEKFSSNKELKEILISTKKAKLVYYRKGRRPILADDLMVVRDKIISLSNINNYDDDELNTRVEAIDWFN